MSANMANFIAAGARERALSKTGWRRESTPKQILSDFRKYYQILSRERLLQKESSQLETSNNRFSSRLKFNVGPFRAI
ncbi:MAG: hypothetical protein GHHEDOFH_00650 [Pseudorhodoplanes sp.]|nr:hypothetical protein [Pseudorhodoplanes sp.]